MRSLLLLLPALLCGAENLDPFKPTPTMDELLAGTPSKKPPEPVISRNTTVIVVRDDECGHCHFRHRKHAKDCDLREDKDEKDDKGDDRKDRDAKSKDGDDRKDRDAKSKDEDAKAPKKDRSKP